MRWLPLLSSLGLVCSCAPPPADTATGMGEEAEEKALSFAERCDCRDNNADGLVDEGLSCTYALSLTLGADVSATATLDGTSLGTKTGYTTASTLSRSVAAGPHELEVDVARGFAAPPAWHRSTGLSATVSAPGQSSMALRTGAGAWEVEVGGSWYPDSAYVDTTCWPTNPTAGSWIATSCDPASARVLSTRLSVAVCPQAIVDDDCDGVDDDGDGLADNEAPDSDGDGAPDCREVAEICDCEDNDGDGLVDEGPLDEDGDGVFERADCAVELVLEGTADDSATFYLDGAEVMFAAEPSLGTFTTNVDTGPHTLAVRAADSGWAFEGLVARVEAGPVAFATGDGTFLITNESPVAYGAVMTWTTAAYPSMVPDDAWSCGPSSLVDADWVWMEDCTDWDHRQLWAIATFAVCPTPETCDGLDNDADGEVDEGFGPDTDADGVPDCADVESCDGTDNDGDGSVDESGPDGAPCPDLDGNGIPDTLEPERCDGIDNNLDGQVDEGFYADSDDDEVLDCVDVEECDFLDNDGDGQIDEGFDDDGDDVSNCVESPEVCDCLDNDNDGRVDEGPLDLDGDGTFETERCEVDIRFQGTADDRFDLYLDGQWVGWGTDPFVSTYDFTVTTGTHHFAATAFDTGAQFVGFLGLVTGGPLYIATGDGQWMLSGEDPGIYSANSTWMTEGYAGLRADDDHACGASSLLDAQWIWYRNCQDYGVFHDNWFWLEFEACPAPEICDGLDNNWDGKVDELWEGDADGDGLLDCADTEECDGVDNDGDGAIDESDPSGAPCPDSDLDGVPDTLDTEDCDGLDNDGDGEVDEGFRGDSDGDGVLDCLDVEDCDGLDNDGDEQIDEGWDIDGDRRPDCHLFAEVCDCLDNDGDGYVDEGPVDTDHDGLGDTDHCTYTVSISSSATWGWRNYLDGVELSWPSGAGTVLTHEAELTFGLHHVAVMAWDSSAPRGVAAMVTVDGVPEFGTGDNVFRIASETPPSAQLTSWRTDGYAAQAPDLANVCTLASPLDGDMVWDPDCTMTSPGADVVRLTADLHICPEAADEPCDGLDNNGDGQVDEGHVDDTDADGVLDCVDTEDCDGIDNDGDGLVDEGFSGDADRDRVLDCVDWEECDGVDNDGDWLVDEDFPADTDGDGVPDCRDRETCDGLDNDGDGLIDEDYADNDGDGLPNCRDVESCDCVDNDGDGQIDEGPMDRDGDGVAETEACAYETIIEVQARDELRLYVDGAYVGPVLATDGVVTLGQAWGNGRHAVAVVGNDTDGADLGVAIDVQIGTDPPSGGATGQGLYWIAEEDPSLWGATDWTTTPYGAMSLDDAWGCGPAAGMGADWIWRPGCSGHSPGNVWVLGTFDVCAEAADAEG